MIVLFVLLGIYLAYFYHYLVDRSINNQSLFKPAAHCDLCNKKLKWFEKIPIFSYIFQGGLCNRCHEKISISYFLSETLLGFLFGFGFFLYGISYELFAFMIIISLVDIVFISDFKYLVILDYPLFISVIIILILKYCYFGFIPTLKSLVSGVILVIFMLIIKLIGDKIYKRESLGWGDVKLSLFIGGVLGAKLGFMAFIIGSFIALPYAIYYAIKKQEKEIPYGPFLVFAVFIVFIFMKNFSEFINIFFMIG